ncbi:MAG: hypothetical protein AB1631_27885 [Acidobacteriota bacterium]
MSRAAIKTKKGNAAKRPSRKRKQAAPELPEKTKKLILKGFRLAYEAHQGKSS